MVALHQSQRDLSRMVIKKELQTTPITFRVSARFKRDMEKAAEASGSPSLSEFLKQAIIEKAKRAGVIIKR